MISDSLLLLAALSLNVALSEWLAERTVLRHLGSALVVIALTAMLANVGLIPVYSDQIPVYSAIFAYVGPLAIFLLLLRVDLRSVLRAGAPMILLFVVGAMGTVAGVLAGMWAVGGLESFGELHYALGGMFVGTYIGGSINFNAIALQYDVVQDGMLYAGAAAVDSAATAFWMAATVALPRLLAGIWPRVRRGAAVPTSGNSGGPEDDRETVRPLDLALLVTLGGAGVWLSDLAHEWSADVLGFGPPSILILTTLALILAQIPAVQRLRGVRVAGWIAVMFFLAVIGALCDLSAVGQMGSLGLRLMAFVSVVILVHGAVVFGAAALLRFGPEMAAVASQANIGGSTSALALARSLGRRDLVLPAVLVGSLGNALGTYLGFLVAAWLR